MELKEYIDKHFNETLDGISRIIKMKTVKEEKSGDAPFGENLKNALNEVLEIAKSLGFKTKNLDNYVGYAEIGSGDEYIGILGHIDVVPEGDISKWSVDPYSATIKDNLMISRGAIDNKGPIISALYAVKAVVETNPSFNKRMRVIFGTNEESGDEDIKHYLMKEKAPKYAFTPDGRFPVIFSEKGIYTFSFREKIEWDKSDIINIEAGSRSNVIPEKAVAVLKNRSVAEIENKIKELEGISSCTFKCVNTGDKVEIVANGRAGHASSPEKGINAILGMYLLLDRIIDENDSMKNFVHFMSQYVGETTDGKLLEIESENKETGNLTISAGITKIVDRDIYVKFNVRYPISTCKQILDEILDKVARDNGIIFVQENYNPPLYFPKDSVLVSSLQKVYKEVTGRDEEPAALGGGTYAKLMPNTVAFGPNFREFKGNAHSPDECMDINMLKTGMEIYGKAILELGKYI